MRCFAGSLLRVNAAVCSLCKLRLVPIGFSSLLHRNRGTMAYVRCTKKYQCVCGVVSEAFSVTPASLGDVLAIPSPKSSTSDGQKIKKLIDG